MARRRFPETASTRRSSPPPPPPRRKASGRMGRWLRATMAWGLILGLMGAVGLFTAVFFAARELPSFSALQSRQQGQTIVVRARDGTQLFEQGPSYGEWLSAAEIPQVMKDATLAVEDHRFHWHFGIDPIGLARALWNAWAGERRVSATSTITQQLARNLFLDSNRTMERKAREAVLAMALEWKFSKEQILELYLNKVYFGGGAYGIDSAARRFFSHSARELSLEEAAIIAGLVKAPSRYAPTANPEAAAERAQVVLAQMVRYGDLDPARAGPIDRSVFRLSADPAGQDANRYFTDWALPQLDFLLTRPPSGPIEVWTTLDPDLQRAATQAIRAHVPPGAQGALVSLDRDGAVLAMVGGTDYTRSTYNRATEAVRQPGSAWKLFVYLVALEGGYLPDDRVEDAPITINGWSPRNANGSFAGTIDVRTAFAYSINTVAARLGQEFGFSNVAAMARRFGITTPVSSNPAMVLGSSEVRVIDMTRAFAAIAAGGKSIEPFGIVRVTDASGRELYRRPARPGVALVPDYVAAGITDLLQTAVATGTGRAAQIGRPVAGKTGTTSSNRDGWFLGFSSGITTGVWMGRDDARAVPGLQGGAAPARAFAQYMRRAVADRPVEEFDTQLQLPAWYLGTGEDLYPDPGDSDYFFYDDNGNLIERDGAGDGQAPKPGEPLTLPPARRDPLDPRFLEEGARRAPPAASEDFLERATGGALP